MTKFRLFQIVLSHCPRFMRKEEKLWQAVDTAWANLRAAEEYVHQFVTLTGECLNPMAEKTYNNAYSRHFEAVAKLRNFYQTAEFV